MKKIIFKIPFRWFNLKFLCSFNLSHSATRRFSALLLLLAFLFLSLRFGLFLSLFNIFIRIPPDCIYEYSSILPLLKDFFAHRKSYKVKRDEAFIKSKKKKNETTNLYEPNNIPPRINSTRR